MKKGKFATIAISTTVLVATGGSLLQYSQSVPVSSVGEGPTSEQAVAFAEGLVAVASGAAGDDLGTFCERFAADQTMCAASLERFRESPYSLDVWEEATITATPSHSGSMIVRLFTAEGPAAKRSSVEVLVSDGKLLAVDPVFWVERTIVG